MSEGAGMSGDSQRFECGERSEADRLLFALWLIDSGRLESALHELKGVEGPAASVARSRALRGLGRVDEGLAELQRAPAGGKPYGPLVVERARALSSAGDLGRARDQLQELVEHDPNFPGALPLLARAVMPGPDYREVLAWFHQRLRPRSYLEIGVEAGRSFLLARSSKHALGIDPNPLLSQQQLPAYMKLFEGTSDDFFAAHAPCPSLGAPVDLAFIDGMHLHEFVLRDLHNVEPWCSEDAIVVLHDCLPPAPVAALRERQTDFWVGDCWRALEWLGSHRRDLRLSVVPCPPSGLVVLSMQASARRPTVAWDTAPADVPYPYGPSEWATRYPLVRNDPTGWACSLGSGGR